MIKKLRLRRIHRDTFIREVYGKINEIIDKIEVLENKIRIFTK